MLTLTLQFDTVENMMAFIQQRATLPAPAAPAPEPALRPQDQPKRSPGRPRTVQPPLDGAAAPSNAPSQASEPAKTDSPPAVQTAKEPATGAPSYDDVRAALMRVNEKFGADGLAKTAAVLTPFGVQRVKELQPEQFAQVIAAAEKLIAA